MKLELWRLNTCSSERSPQPGFPHLSLFTVFIYLQFLDLLTTLVFLSHGVQEANPLVRFAITAAHSRLLGLLIIKAFAFAAALYCVRSARFRLLLRINVFFAALVVWNLLAMLA